METAELLQKKRSGDAPRIRRIVNSWRTEKGERPYGESTIRSMMNGQRTLQPDVAKAMKLFYQSQEQLLTIKN